MAAEFQGVLIGFKSGVVLKTEVEGGPAAIVKGFSEAIGQGRTATRLFSLPPSFGHLFDVCEVAFVVPASGFEVISAK